MMIEDTTFGRIKVLGEEYDHDIVILPDKIIKRKKEITKNKHGTSHKLTKEEVKDYLKMCDIDKIKKMIIGTGQYDKLHPLPETQEYLKENNIEFFEIRTDEMVGKLKEFGDRDEMVVLFHVTC